VAKGGKEIRRRIRSVKSTQQITKAMKMMAAARLRRSEGRTAASRPYTDTLQAVMRDLTAVAGEIEHPYLSHLAPDVPRVLLLFLTSDKGLCGAFNTNLIKRAQAFVNEQTKAGRSVEMICAGRKGKSFAAKADAELLTAYPSFTDKTTYADLRKVSDLLTEAYLNKRVSEVYLIYARYVNVVRSIPTLVRLLPIEQLPEAAADEAERDYMLEPNPPELLALLLPRYFQTILFQAAIENFTSENGSRMVAMENATKAAEEMIDYLTLQYNKARQAGITLELLDIVGGAEALKG